MPKLSDHAIDPKKLEGVWWDYERKSTCPGNRPTPGAGCLLIVPMVGNDAFHNALDERMTRHSGTLRDKVTPEDVKRKIRQAAWAESAAGRILRGWAGWDDMPTFTEAKAVELLTDIRWKAVAEFVVMASNSIDAALLREEEQAKGN
jgi:hypothetical protein